MSACRPLSRVWPCRSSLALDRHQAALEAQRGAAVDHKAVRHVDGEYVRGDAHTNGTESFWSMLKRARKATFHHLSAKHALERTGAGQAAPAVALGGHHVDDLAPAGDQLCDLQRYVTEFASRHNTRDADTIDMMRRVAISTAGKRLMYKELVAK